MCRRFWAESFLLGKLDGSLGRLGPEAALSCAISQVSVKSCGVAQITLFAKVCYRVVR